MTNTNDRGVQHRKQRMAALRKSMGFPHVAPLTAGLNFAAVDAQNEEILVGIAKKAILDRCDTLLHCYESVSANDVDQTILVYRTPAGADLFEVEMVERSKFKPLELITTDGKRCFTVDRRFQLIETKAQPVAKLTKALRAAERRYEAALEGETGKNATWDPQVVIFQTGPDSMAA